MARDGISQARAQHDEFVLAFVFRRARGAANGVIETPQRAARAGIHIADSHHDRVGLVIQIQTVADQLVEIDILGKIESSATRTRTAISTRTPFARFTFGAAFAAGLPARLHAAHRRVCPPP